MVGVAGLGNLQLWTLTILCNIVPGSDLFPLGMERNSCPSELKTSLTEYVCMLAGWGYPTYIREDDNIHLVPVAKIHINWL